MVFQYKWQFSLYRDIEQFVNGGQQYHCPQGVGSWIAHCSIIIVCNSLFNSNDKLGPDRCTDGILLPTLQDIYHEEDG